MAANYSVRWYKQVHGYFCQYISFLSLYSLSELLAQHADSENTAEASAAAATGLPVLSIPPWAGTADVMLGAPAVDRGRILNHGEAQEENHYGLFFRCFIC